jgi:hypothetical protein
VALLVADWLVVFADVGAGTTELEVDLPAPSGSSPKRHLFLGLATSRRYKLKTAAGVEAVRSSPQGVLSLTRDLSHRINLRLD